MGTLNTDPKELNDVEGFDSTDNASVPSAISGRTGPAQNTGPAAAVAVSDDVKSTKKKKKTLAQRLGPKKLVRQTVSGVKGAADKVESLVRGDSWTRQRRARRSSVDPVKMAADTAYRRRTKDLETLVSVAYCHRSHCHLTPLAA